MNIFYLERSPSRAAHFHADRHCVKMVVETAQMLSTALWFDEANRRDLLPWRGAIGKLWLRIAEDDFAAVGGVYSDAREAYIQYRLSEIKCPIERQEFLSKEPARIRVLRHHLSTHVPNSLYALVYNPTHVNHPSAQWARSSLSHYRWLCQLGLELCYEYTRRYGRRHATQDKLEFMAANEPSFSDNVFVDPPQCMPDDVKCSDAVEAYRAYYRKHKAYMATWRYCEEPAWWRTPGT